MNQQTELKNAIMQLFKLESNIFIEGQIVDAISQVPVDEYQEFFKALTGDGFDYKNPLDRVEIVSKRFKDKDEQPLIEARKDEATALSDSLLSKSNALSSYAQRNRDKHPNDLHLFMNFKFKNRYDPQDHTKPYFSDKEVYIINEMGREWFMNVSTMSSFAELVKQVELCIAKAQHKKELSAVERKLLK